MLLPFPFPFPFPSLLYKAMNPFDSNARQQPKVNLHGSVLLAYEQQQEKHTHTHTHTHTEKANNATNAKQNVFLPFLLVLSSSLPHFPSAGQRRSICRSCFLFILFSVLGLVI